MHTTPYFADRLVRAMNGSINVESPIWPGDEAPESKVLGHSTISTTLDTYGHLTDGMSQIGWM